MLDLTGAEEEQVKDFLIVDSQTMKVLPPGEPPKDMPYADVNNLFMDKIDIQLIKLDRITSFSR